MLWPGVSAGGAPAGNRLYYGDNLLILSDLLGDDCVRGKVRLVYIDPPFATQSAFETRSQSHAYEDLLAGANYVEYIRERLIFLRELLSSDGSIYVHLDQKMAFAIKIIMDEVFGSTNFRNWITRKKCNPKNYTRKAYGNVSDFILFYTKSPRYVWHRPFREWTAERGAREYTYVEKPTGRRYKKVPIHAPGVRHGETGKPWRGLAPPPGKHWQFPPRTLEEMDSRGEIHWSTTGNPRRKIYLDNSKGVPVQDIWLEFRDPHNQNIKITGYPTEKNPDLLRRIINASSDQGDLVLDGFCGSGTTLAVASELGRRWIGIDNSPEAIGTVLRRFARGLEPMGDFVRRQRLVSKRARTSEPPTLFEDWTTDQGVPAIGSRVRMIRDFSLFASEPYSGELKRYIEDWQRSL
jgi:adenine-specific DNA-methyltransferase